MSLAHSTPIPAPAMLDERAASIYLGVSPRLLYDLRKSGQLPSVTVGKRGVRYRLLDLDGWMAAQASKSVGTATKL